MSLFSRFWFSVFDHDAGGDPSHLSSWQEYMGHNYVALRTYTTFDSVALVGAIADHHGYSGGPSYANRNGMQVQIRVHRGGTYGLYGVDTRVDAYVDWIVSNAQDPTVRTEDDVETECAAAL